MRYLGLSLLVLMQFGTGVFAADGGATNAQSKNPSLFRVQLVQAQEIDDLSEEEALSVEVSLYVRDGEENIVWSHTKSELVHEGTPVHLNVEGKNIRLYGQLFALKGEDEHVLTVHMQTWLRDQKRRKVIYRNFSESIKVKEKIPVEIFPLGNLASADEKESLLSMIFNRLFKEQSSMNARGRGRLDAQNYQLSMQVIIGKQ